jgi:neutral ceramidase
MVDADRRFYIDALAAYLIKSPSQSLRKCHYPKAVLLAMGETLPFPSLPQVLPIGLIQIGDIGILVSPNEVTTMASRRLKSSVKVSLGSSVTELILSGLSNDFAGYITTKEEYQSQQYEGGHTLFGPNTLIGFQQEYVRLSQDLMKNLPSTSDALPRDLSTLLKERDIPFSDERGYFFAKVIEPNAKEYKKGSVVSCKVSSVNPNVGYPHIASYFQVERNFDGEWMVVYTDGDLSTKFKFSKPRFPFYQGHTELEWETEFSDVTGEYRLVHNSKYRDSLGKLQDYEVKCPSFMLR